MTGPKPKKYTVNGKTYAILTTGTDEGGNGLATVECDGITHRNLLGASWQEFIDSFEAVNSRVRA